MEYRETYLHLQVVPVDNGMANRTADAAAIQAGTTERVHKRLHGVLVGSSLG